MTENESHDQSDHYTQACKGLEDKLNTLSRKLIERTIKAEEDRKTDISILNEIKEKINFLEQKLSSYADSKQDNIVSFNIHHEEETSSLSSDESASSNPTINE